MSETPICDKHKYETDQGAEVVPLHIAIELECKLHEREREVGEANAKWLKLNDQLAEAQATAMELGEQKQILNKMTDHNERELTDKDRQLAEITRQRNAYKKALEMAEDGLMTVRAGIESLKLSAGELNGAFNARPKCEKCKAKVKLIEQMRDALNILVASAPPSGPLWHGSAEMQIVMAALSAAERGLK